MTTARSYTDDLVDILDGLVKIEPLIEGMTLDRSVQNEKNEKTVSAVVGAMESIEESPKRIPSEVRERYPEEGVNLSSDDIMPGQGLDITITTVFGTLMMWSNP